MNSVFTFFSEALLWKELRMQPFSFESTAVYSNYWCIHMYSHVYKYLEGSLFNNKLLDKHVLLCGVTYVAKKGKL